MIFFPNCKINLGLQILNKREDGYHNLATIFYPVGIKDALEAMRKDGAEHDVSFQSSGLVIEGATENNLCIKAYSLLKKDFPSLPPVQMHLHKAIPMGAGLGGGSSDGAFALQLLNKQFQLGLTTQQLIDYALQLGSDCPFFIINKPSYATGRGEVLESVDLDLSAYQFLIVNPGIHINTGWAFSQLSGHSKWPNKYNGSGRSERPDPKTIIQQPITTWKNELINDFEAPVCKAHPAIATIKQQLYDAGAVYASMTGSGSTVFGVFEKGVKVDTEFQGNYFIRNVI